jgi:hypothetical protein
MGAARRHPDIERALTSGGGPTAIERKNVTAAFDGGPAQLTAIGGIASVPRCACTADSATVVWRRLIRAVSGGSLAVPDNSIGMPRQATARMTDAPVDRPNSDEPTKPLSI